ncbi:hypothetical protein BH10ACT1_BH10ACT1_11770 [soil metagenome]
MSATAATPPLLHPRVRSAFREAASDCGIVRHIERAFEDEGLDPAEPDERDWYGPGQRRGTFDRYTYAVDWSDPRQVRQVLNVFEQILDWTTEGEHRDNLVRHLQRDGYTVDDSLRIRGGSAASLALIPLDQLTDPSSIYEHLERIAATTDSDPGVAISGAKALIEATTKLVLAELGEPYDERADVPALVKAAQKALLLHPDSLAPTKPGVDITKRILSNLSQLAIGVAELRNQYGPDHGRTTAVVGLRPRHAHMAVGAASTYCRMLLETLAARTHEPPLDS